VIVFGFCVLFFFDSYQHLKFSLLGIKTFLPEKPTKRTKARPNGIGDSFQLGPSTTSYNALNTSAAGIIRWSIRRYQSGLPRPRKMD
jgi:hypothetical protein